MRRENKEVWSFANKNTADKIISLVLLILFQIFFNKLTVFGSAEIEQFDERKRDEVQAKLYETVNKHIEVNTEIHKNTYLTFMYLTVAAKNFWLQDDHPF